MVHAGGIQDKTHLNREYISGQRWKVGTSGSRRSQSVILFAQDVGLVEALDAGLMHSDGRASVWALGRLCWNCLWENSLCMEFFLYWLGVMPVYFRKMKLNR